MSIITCSVKVKKSFYFKKYYCYCHLYIISIIIFNLLLHLKFPFSLPNSQSHCPVAPPTALHMPTDLAVCPRHSLSCHAQGYAADSYGSLQPGTGWHTLMNDAALAITQFTRESAQRLACTQGAIKADLKENKPKSPNVALGWGIF